MNHVARYASRTFEVPFAGRRLTAVSLAGLASALVRAGAAPDDTIAATGAGMPGMVPVRLSSFDPRRLAATRETAGMWARERTYARSSV